MFSTATAFRRMVPMSIAAALAHSAQDAFAAERDRWILWLPVLVGAGIASYFALSSEPPPWLGTMLLAACAAAATLTVRLCGERHPLLPIAMMFLLCVAAGFAVAQAQSLVVGTRMLNKTLGPVMLQARVVNTERFPDGQRLTIDHLSVAGLPKSETPTRARLRLRGSQPTIRPGEEIRLRATLMPPPAPAMPGGYDFQRQAYFEGLGAVGYSVGRASIVAAANAQPADDKDARLWFARLRFAVGERVRTHLEGATAAVTTALLTGEQRAIPVVTMEAIRDSGLAHLLSISGLHIGLVAGIVFVVARSTLALVPWLALRYPIKKWAAVASVLAAGAYTLLADAPVPSQRSFLMVAVVLLAVLVDRQGISMRLVAFAALVILLTQPHAMLGPSFQMSFAAVVALIAAYEIVQDRRRAPQTPPSPLRMLLLYVGGGILSTLVASLATTPFAVYHFNRFQLWGIAANMIAVPVTGFWIMPWAMIAMLLMPFGWEGIGLQPMGWGVDVVIAVAREVAAWPAAVMLLPPLPTPALALIALGGAWLCLWRRRWRLLGLPAIAAGTLFLLAARPPDLLIGADGKLLAVRGTDGGLFFSSKSAGRSTREAWLRRSAASEAQGYWPRRGSSADGLLQCDELGCVYRLNGHTVAISRFADALQDDCRLADIVISLVPLRGACRSARAVVDRGDLAGRGAHVLWIDRDRVRVESTDGSRGHRPWVLPRRQPRDDNRHNVVAGPGTPEEDEAEGPPADPGRAQHQ
jgi:competence protein ComEC